MCKKVLVTDKLACEGVEILKARGCAVDVKLGLAPEELEQIVPAYDALIVRSGTQVTRKVIEAAQNLCVIGRAGVGVDNVDVEAATEHGVIVCNAPRRTSFPQPSTPWRSCWPALAAFPRRTPPCTRASGNARN